jgi:DNA-binding beta-propeller fold protein YncE
MSAFVSHISASMVNFALFLAMVPSASGISHEHRDAKPTDQPQQVLALEGGRRLDFLRTFSSESDLKSRPSFWKRAINFMAGPPDSHPLIRPYSITTDSHGRVLVTDPGDLSVHIFDFDQKKYSRLDKGKHGEAFRSPIGIAVDRDDNIYVSDSVLGKIFVFDARGKFRRYIGAINETESFFKRPTGITIDQQRGEIYIADTLRDKIYVTDLEGHPLREFGSRGAGPGEFNFPTEVAVRGDEVFVVDAMNFRVQIFDGQGQWRAQLGSEGASTGRIFRPKGIALDSEGNIYLVDALFELVQVFNRSGSLLYYFGQTGGETAHSFQLPSGIWIDGSNHVYVADSYNHRVDMFQFVTGQQAASEGRK